MYKRMVLEFCAVDQNYTCSMYMLYMYIHCMKCTYTVQACLCMSHGLYVGHTCIAPNVCTYSVWSVHYFDQISSFLTCKMADTLVLKPRSDLSILVPDSLLF